MKPNKIITYVDTIEKNIECIIGADIGGTNSNFGVFKVTNNIPQLLFSIHYKSQYITNFTDLFVAAVDFIKQEYAITISHMCIAAAGVVSENRDWVKPTNLPIEIRTKDIIARTGMNCAFLVNDFEVIGYGLRSILSNNLVHINEGKMRNKANRAILGAGTGLGKCIMIWDRHTNRHIPSASEGGHADFSAQNKQDLDFIEFIQDRENITCNISWEDVLSGKGIERMYKFFQKQCIGKCDDNGPHPDEIFNFRHDNEAAQKTFEYYTQLYARCAKNLALDALAFGGLYIAGGIASKNLPMFSLPIFMQEFTACGKQEQLLNEIPIYVIADYNVSLYGAAWYLLLEHKC